MHSGREMQFLDAGVESLTANIKNISANENLRIRTILNELLPPSETLADASQVEPTRKLLESRTRLQE
jgi:hypothetical protein